MTYREIWTIWLWRDRLRRAMVFKQLRIWELATARNRRPRNFFPAVEECRFQGGLWNSAGVKCNVTMFWVDIGPVQHNSNWAVLVEQQGEGPIPKVPNKRWGIFFALSFFQRQNTAFFTVSTCIFTMIVGLPHLQSLMNSGNTKGIWYWRSYHVKPKLRRPNQHMPTDSEKHTKLLGYVVTLSPRIMEVKNGGIWKVTIIVLLEGVTFKFHDYLGGGFKFVLFSSLLREMIQFDEHIFQRGCKNQLVLWEEG